VDLKKTGMINIIKITNHSLEPDFQDGDYVVISKIPLLWRKARQGDVVAFHKPPYGLMIKRVEYLTPGGDLFVLGTHAASVDSLQFGPIRPQDILGKVIWHEKKPRRE
jgi:signal peptidase I